jgi:ribose transport system permease protein
MSTIHQLRPRTAEDERAVPRARLRPALARALSPARVSALYVGLAFFILFALWVPDTFLTATTLRTLLADQAISAMVALGLVLPLAAGVFDLSIGMAVGLGTIMVAWLIGDHGMAIVPACLLAIAAGSAVGLINASLVAGVGVDSFIATLGITSVLTAVVTAISGGNTVIGLPASFQSIATDKVFGVALPVFYLLVLAIVMWFVLEHTPLGRRVYATGGNAEAARLSGVHTKRVIVGALILASTIAATAGVLGSARVAAGSPDVGVGYLIPAFSAAFLGSTQIRPGHFNVWGTILAVYVLAIGVRGLQLAGAPFWLPDLFNGLALVIAVGAARLASPELGAGRLIKRFGRRRALRPEGA